MPFADLDGSVIDVYQAAHALTDESGQAYPFTVDALLDNALGPRATTASSSRTSTPTTPRPPDSDAILASAQAHGVPVISAKQLLDWLDGRERVVVRGASAGTATRCDFTVDADAGANGCQAMLPIAAGGGTLTAPHAGGASRCRTRRGRSRASRTRSSARASGTYAAVYG